MKKFSVEHLEQLKEVFEKIEELQAAGKMAIGGLHAYATFTHYDIRGTKARW